MDEARIVKEIVKERDNIEAMTEHDVTYSLKFYVMDLLNDNYVVEGEQWIGSPSTGEWYQKEIVKERETKFFNVFFIKLLNDEKNEVRHVYLLKLKDEFKKYEDEVIE